MRQRKMTKRTEVAVKYFGENYQVEVIVLAEKKIGERIRLCIASDCRGRVKKEIFTYRLSRFGAIKDQNGDLVSGLSPLYRKIDRDMNKIVIEANKVLNSWPDKIRPIDINLPEFQPEGAFALDERLLLCDDCVSKRQAILEKELMTGVE